MPSKYVGRVDLMAALKDTNLRRTLFVSAIRALQAREGIETTQEQAEAAYDKVQREKGRPPEAADMGLEFRVYGDPHYDDFVIEIGAQNHALEEGQKEKDEGSKKVLASDIH